MKVKEVWFMGCFGFGVIVVVVDDGVQLNYFDLRKNIVKYILFFFLIYFVKFFLVFC